MALVTLQKGWKLRGVRKVIIETLSKGLVIPSIAQFTQKEVGLFDFLLKQQPAPRQVKTSFRLSTSKGRIVILGRNVSASGQIFTPDFRPLDKILLPEMAFRPLDE